MKLEGLRPEARVGSCWSKGSSSCRYRNLRSFPKD